MVFRSEAELTLRVDKECLFPSDRMCADDGMSMEDGLASLDATLASASIGLFKGGMDGPKPVESLFEERAQSVVSLSCVGKKCVTSNLWLVENVQEGGPRGLRLIRDIGMPSYRTGTCAEKLIGARVTGCTVYKVNLGKVFW